MRRLGRGLVAAAALVFLYLSYVYLTLPDVRVLAKENPKTTAFMQLRIEEAEDEDRRFAIRHRWVPYGRISQNLKRAVVVTEDAAFFDHEGIDLDEIKASFERNWEEGRFARGASTITQQLAKNLFLDGSERTLVRKLRELVLAVELDRRLGKARVLELYLNVVELGPGVYGVGPAAEAWFLKSPAGLSWKEAALLAAILPAPRTFWQTGLIEGRPPQARVDRVIDNLVRLDRLPREEAARARAEPLVVIPPPP